MGLFKSAKKLLGKVVGLIGGIAGLTAKLPKPQKIGDEEKVTTPIGDTGAAAAWQKKKSMSLLSQAGMASDNLGGAPTSASSAKPTLGF